MLQDESYSWHLSPASNGGEWAAKPTFRYWGKEKHAHKIMVFLDMIWNDLPQWRYNTSTLVLGIYTHRRRWSCIYDDKWTPSCRNCELHRLENILCGRDEEAMILSCDTCSNWWSPIWQHVYTAADVYSIDPADLHLIASGENKTGPIPVVELSFELVENSIAVLQNWYQQSNNGNFPQKKRKTTGENRRWLSAQAGSVPTACPWPFTKRI